MDYLDSGLWIMKVISNRKLLALVRYMLVLLALLAVAKDHMHRYIHASNVGSFTCLIVSFYLQL
jgi:hypothetical protein